MGETAGQIENEIENTREELHSHLQELEGRVLSATDWRRQFRKRPFLFLGLAVGAGWIFARMIR